MAHGLYHIAGARFAFRANHGGAFLDAPQGFAQVASAAHEWNGELGFVDVVGVVGGRQHFRFVDVIDFDGLQDLSFGEVTDAAFGHHGDGDRLLDAPDHGRVAHAGHAASGSDVGGDALQRHDGAGAGGLGDASLFGGGHIHNHAAFEHLGQLAVQGLAVLGAGCSGRGDGAGVGRRSVGSAGVSGRGCRGVWRLGARFALHRVPFSGLLRALA